MIQLDIFITNIIVKAAHLSGIRYEFFKNIDIKESEIKSQFD